MLRQMNHYEITCDDCGAKFPQLLDRENSVGHIFYAVKHLLETAAWEVNGAAHLCPICKQSDGLIPPWEPTGIARIAGD